ncbi:MAG: peptidoglycan-binding protein [Acidobacteriales bacterium]|nr:peptidoglycan-binding protein [Terriglobales bacterium]
MSQRSPTPERYKEIQQALMQRGYLAGVATGVWDTSSMDAMKRFQKDQNLPLTGKPSGLALIALGLGPKREPDSQNGQFRPGVPPKADSRTQP